MQRNITVSYSQNLKKLKLSSALTTDILVGTDRYVDIQLIHSSWRNLRITYLRCNMELQPNIRISILDPYTVNLIKKSLTKICQKFSNMSEFRLKRLKI